MQQVSVARLHEDNREALALDWVAGRASAAAVRREAAAAAALIGHLNLTHPYSVQVIGNYEAALAARHDAARRRELAARLIGAGPAVVVFADGVAPFPELVEAAEAAHTAVFATAVSAARVIEKLGRYLAKQLADTVERHGVMMDVLGVGVLITGDSGVGKSELALELVSRGHGLVADDVVEISRIAPTTLEARCPPLLKDFIEVRGLGLINIRAIYGETAVRPKMKLKLVAHLEKPGGAAATERLPLAELAEDILGVTVRKVVIPVAAGRNLAVLLETAVRNYILQLRGIDSAAEFLARQKRAMSGEG
ncbi:MAG: HPr(Ser) kinase/phosphatase [Burkholderiales bacterium]|nr:HPr(Ser) kinase/phosphatase [Burkholderiales bacterium]